MDDTAAGRKVIQLSGNGMGDRAWYALIATAMTQNASAVTVAANFATTAESRWSVVRANARKTRKRKKSPKMTNLPKGTRVEITDWGHASSGVECEIVGERNEEGEYPVVILPRYRDTLNPDQFVVLPVPPPTTGQLYDEMIGVIEQLSERLKMRLTMVALSPPTYERAWRVSVKLNWWAGPIRDFGETPQAALTKMIDRLRGMLANLPK